MNRVAALAALTAALAAAAPAAAAKPNLKATSVTPPPTAVQELAKFKVADTVKNAARGKARASDVRFYLTTDPAKSIKERKQSKSNPRTALADIVLHGFRAVPALEKGDSSSSKRKTAVTVPLGTPAGSYFLLACADDRGAVAESKEGDNCVASKRAAKVNPRPAPEYRLDSFRDWYRDPSAQEEAQNLGVTKSYACTPTPGGNKAPSLKKALTSIDKQLRAKAPQGMAQFKQSPDYRNANRAEAAAAAALLAKSPGAALAAMTRAHQLEPKEASHLISAGAIATSIGMPREGLALLEASQRLDDRVRGAWGMNRQAVFLANKAQALASLGRFAEAEAAADAARVIEPTLGEASATASTAALCQSKIPVAVVKKQQSRRRTPPGTPPPGPPIDIEFGFGHELRKLDLPGFPTQSPRLLELYKVQNNRQFAEIDKHNQRQSELEEILRNKQVEPLQERQGSRLLVQVYRAHLAPYLEAKDKKITDKLGELTDLREGFFCGDNHCSPERTKYTTFTNEASDICAGNPDEDYSTCYTREMRERCVPALKTAHAEWLDKMEELHALAADHHRERSRLMSAIAAHIKDADRHALALLQIAQLESGAFHLVQQQGFFWTHESNLRKDYCIESEDPSVPVEDEQPEDPEGSGCPEALKPLNAVLDVGVGALKVNCEEIQFEVETKGWIAGFAEFSYDYRAGKVSIFAGSKAQFVVPGYKNEFKSGLYVEVGNEGMEDIGWRIEKQRTYGAGTPIEYAPKDKMDMTFIGIFSGSGD
jgi:tetratricopeptide (TPR) repeat protein